MDKNKVEIHSWNDPIMEAVLFAFCYNRPKEWYKNFGFEEMGPDGIIFSVPTEAAKELRDIVATCYEMQEDFPNFLASKQAWIDIKIESRKKYHDLLKN